MKGLIKIRHIFMINPAAGKSDCSEKMRAEIESVCGKYGIEPLICISEHENYEREMTAKMCSFFSNEEIRIYSIGGSGSLLNVISGITDFANTEVACCPAGLTNDMLKSFRDPSLFSAIDNLVNGRVMQMDLMELNGSILVPDFISIGAGTPRESEGAFIKLAGLLKPALPYRLGIFIDFLSNRCCDLTVTVNGTDYSGKYILAACFNGRCMGGNVYPVRSSVPNDGIMDVVLAEEMPLSEKFSALKACTNGVSSAPNSKLHLIRTSRIDFRLNSDEPMKLNCDGEVITINQKAFSVRLLPNKLKFVVPEGTELVYC